jgi:hypothetical protein
LNIVEVFEEQVIKTTEQTLKQTLEKLKKDELLKRKFRELVDISRELKRFRGILSSDIDLDRDTRVKWVKKRDELSKKRDEMYSEIKDLGFEHWWITTIVNYEMEKLDKLIDDARENAYKKIFGKVNIDDIDILDNRWELVGQEIEQVKATYFEGK